MLTRKAILGALFAIGLFGCSSDQSQNNDSKPGDAASDTKNTDSMQADDGSVDGSMSSSGAACQQAGGQCACSCSHPFPLQSDEHNDCPQPCATCGACSMFCCVPDPDCDAALGCI